MKTVFIQGLGGLGQGFAECLLQADQYEHIILAVRDQTKVPEHLQQHQKISAVAWDLNQPAVIDQALAQIKNKGLDLQLILNCQGVLKQEQPKSALIQPQALSNVGPERRIENLTAGNMLYNFEVNTVVPMLTIQALWPLLRKESFAWVVNISAKVGSIGDNGLGGWYSYRSSKAALNMLTKTLSVELQQRHVNAGVLAIHPGTVRTSLSDPFIHKKSDQRLSPQESATAILNVIQSKTIDDSGSFWSWDGTALPW